MKTRANESRRNASPRARRALKQRNIEIGDNRLKGSGPRGRIIESDVLRWANEQAETKTESTSSTHIFRLRASCDATKVSSLVTRHSLNPLAPWGAVDLALLCIAHAWREVKGESCRVGLLVQGVRSNMTVLPLGELEAFSLATIAQLWQETQNTKQAPCDAVLCFDDLGVADEIEAPLFGSACSFGIVQQETTIRICLAFDGEKMAMRDANALLRALWARLEDPNLLFFG